MRNDRRSGGRPMSKPLEARAAERQEGKRGT